MLWSMGSQGVRTTTKVLCQLPTQQANAEAGTEVFCAGFQGSCRSLKGKPCFLSAPSACDHRRGGQRGVPPHRPCPTTELNSDTVHLALALDPTGEGLPPSLAQRPIRSPDACTSKLHPPPLSLGLTICAVPHRTQEGPLFTRSPVFYKRIQLGNSQRKPCTGLGMEEGLTTPLPGAPRPSTSCIHQPGSSANL